jgi:hypothetical protein
MNDRLELEILCPNNHGQTGRFHSIGFPKNRDESRARSTSRHPRGATAFSARTTLRSHYA